MLAWIAAHVIAAISQLGYWGVFLMMTIEAACIPLPSELILTFSGFLISTGRFSIVWVTIVAALGNNVGSMIVYTIGYWGGPPVARRYGRLLLLAPGDLDRAEAWFRRRGDITVLVCRMLPVVRTYIGLPAGVARMPVLRFNIYTFIGSLPWCFLLSYIGYRLGANWSQIAPYFHRFDVIWAPLLIVLVALAIWHHVARFRREFRSNRIKISQGAK